MIDSRPKQARSAAGLPLRALEANVIDRGALYSTLKAISDHPRCRLPQPEVTERLDRWRLAAS